MSKEHGWTFLEREYLAFEHGIRFHRYPDDPGYGESRTTVSEAAATEILRLDDVEKRLSVLTGRLLAACRVEMEGAERTAEEEILLAIERLQAAADLARPRDPKKELPEEGQDAFLVNIYGMPIGTTFKESDRKWWLESVRAWWPAPQLPAGGGK